MFDYGARFYDPVIGRWNVVERMINLTYSKSSPKNEITLVVKPKQKTNFTVKERLIGRGSIHGIDFRFTQFSQGNPIPVLTFQGGQVGLVTTDPDTQLAVNGTMHSKEVSVDLTGWPDYVFEPKYNLLTLSEITAYINRNKRLPRTGSE